MNTLTFFSLLIIMAAVYLTIGKVAAANLKNNDDYFLGGRGFGVVALTLTLLATQFGGGMLLGSTDVAYQQGWIALLYPLGVALGLIILALGIGAKFRQMNIATIPEVFEKVYGSTTLRKIASLVSLITLFFILVGQVVAVRKFFIALGYEQIWILFSLWSVILFYTMIGGLRAVVYTDITQILFIVGAFLLIIGLTQNEVNAVIDFQASFSGTSTDVPWLTWLLMPMFFMVIGQDMGQRCFSAKSPRTISIAMLLSAALLLICASFPIYFGIYAKSAGMIIPEGASVLMVTLQSLLNPYTTALFAVALLLAVISTADSLLCSISSIIVYDFDALKKASQHHLSIAKIVTLVVGFGAFGASFYFENIIDLFVHSYAFSICVLFVPILLGLVFSNLSRASAAVAMAVGAGGYILFSFIEPFILKELLVLFLALMGFALTQLFIKNQSN